MNLSKQSDPRQWRKWKLSGAVVNPVEAIEAWQYQQAEADLLGLKFRALYLKWERLVWDPDADPEDEKQAWQELEPVWKLAKQFGLNYTYDIPPDPR